MSRRSRGAKDARAKATNRAPAHPHQGPLIIRSAPTMPMGATTAAPRTRARRPREDQCPVCGADIFEEGATSCCNAMVAECEGSIDGVPVDWANLDSDEESDRLLDLAVHHAWYLDTGKPAPSDYTRGAEPVACRCEQRPHAHV